MLSPYHPLQLAFGLIVWAVYFVTLYSALSIACAVAPPNMQQGSFTWLNFALLSLTFVTGLWLLYQAWRCKRLTKQLDPASQLELQQRDAGSNQLHEFRVFIGSLAAATNLVAGLATLAIGTPVAVLTPCL